MDEAHSSPPPGSPRYPAWLPTALYWALPVALAGVQLLFSRHTNTLLRYEEVAESIRNVYWLDHRLLYDGISSNVGWYGLLLVVYQLFGFSLFTARWLRVALHLGALLCLAWLLRRRLAPGRAAVPLIAIGLSPSLLFFNTLQTTFGTDLVLLPYALVCLALLGSAAPAASGLRGSLLAALLGGVAMFAAMCYPVFLFYLPALALLLWWQLNAGAGRPRWSWPPWWPAASAGVGFVTPLAAAVLWLREPRLLFYDERTGSGLFRGGGGSFTTDGEVIRASARRVVEDLVVEGESYYFWLGRPELGGWLGWASLALVVGGSVALFVARRRLRPLLAAIWMLGLANLLFSSASLGPPGLRRATALIAGFYALFVLLWEALAGDRGRRWATRAGLLACLLLPLHHLLVAPANYRELPQGGRKHQQVWFQVAETPEAALRHWLAWTADGRPLDCLEIGVRPRHCQYSGIYGALAGYRRWNGLERVPISGYDPWRDVHMELSVGLWQRWEFPH